MVAFLNCEREKFAKVSVLLGPDFKNKVVFTDSVPMQAEVIVATSIDDVKKAFKEHPVARIILVKDIDDQSEMCKLAHESGLSDSFKPEDIERLAEAIVDNYSKKKDLNHYSAQVPNPVKLNEKGNIQIEGFKTNNIIGQSPQLQKAVTDLARLSKFKYNVLITGENGVGKGMFFKALQENFAGKTLTGNVAQMHEETLIAELFGYKKGAFTGAIADSKGLFGDADGGLLILDEIGEMKLQHQSKLLEVLQDGTYRRMGESASHKVNVQIVFATNQPLERMVKEGKFREDLYHRISHLNVTIPPLRERAEDIMPLVVHFVESFNKLHPEAKIGINQEAIDVLSKLQWPGNVRQLEGTVKAMCVTAGQPGTVITQADVLAHLAQGDMFKREMYDQYTQKSKQESADVKVTTGKPAPAMQI